MTIQEQMEVIKMAASQEYFDLTIGICLGVILLTLVLLAICWWGEWWENLKDKAKAHKGFVANALLVTVFYAGAKPNFTFSNGVSNNGSYVTNDTQVVALWRCSAIVGDGNYTLKGQYRDHTVTNSSGEVTSAWQELPDVDAHLLTYTYNVANATNMSFVFWANYVAPVVVHTNGVYHLAGLHRSINDDYTANYTNDPPTYVLNGTQIRVVDTNDEWLVITPTNAPPAGGALMLGTSLE